MKEQDILNWDELQQTQEALKLRFKYLSEAQDRAVALWGWTDPYVKDWIKRQQHCAKAYQKIERQMFPYSYETL